MLHAREDYNLRVQDISGIIPDDEPVFLLRGQDILATETLEHYIIRLKAMGGDPRILALLEEHLTKMAKWSMDHSSKLPDLPDVPPGGVPKSGVERIFKTLKPSFDRLSVKDFISVIEDLIGDRKYSVSLKIDSTKEDLGHLENMMVELQKAFNN